MWRPPAASTKAPDGAGLLLSLGARSWGQILGPDRGARSWGQILEPDLGARSWGQILGPDLGGKRIPWCSEAGGGRQCRTWGAAARPHRFPWQPPLPRSPKRRGSHARFASFRCQTGEDFNLLPGYG